MAYAIVSPSDPKDLTNIPDEEALSSLFKQEGEEIVPPLVIPHAVRDVLLSVQTARVLRAITESDKPDAIKKHARAALNPLEERMASLAQRYGASLAEAYEQSRAFCLDSNFEPAQKDEELEPSLANFDEASTGFADYFRVSRQIHEDMMGVVQDDEADLLATAAPDLAEDMILETSGTPAIMERLARIRDRFYTDPEVRLAFRSRRFLEDVKSIHAEGKKVIETATVTETLNRIHSKMFGRPPRDALGVVLGGPPGLGKTVILEHYIREALGVEAISIDISQGQNAFTLMAYPRLAEADPVRSPLQTLDQLQEMDGDVIKQVIAARPELRKQCGIEEDDDDDMLRAKLSKGPRKLVADAMANVLVTSNTRGLFEYGPIYQALERNVPIIINEIQGLRGQEFLHSLMTAIPATDEEAGPMPTWTPQEGQSINPPVGWFYSTLTSRWMRVPDRFRICITGNFGAEFGNQGLPPAVLSRGGDRVEEMPLLPTNELVDLAWARTANLSGRQTLSVEEATKFYFFLTMVMPEIEKMYSLSGVRPQERVYFSIRTIIAITEALCPPRGPRGQRKPASLEQAVFETYIQPGIVNHFDKSVEIAVGALTVAGIIGPETLEKIKVLMPSLKTGQLQHIQEDLMGSGTTALAGSGQTIQLKALEFDYDQRKGTIEQECALCGLCNCPAHSEEVEEHLEDILARENILHFGLDEKVVEALSSYYSALAANESWEHLLDSQGEVAVEGARAVDILTGPQQRAFADYWKDRFVEKAFKGLFAEPDDREKKTPKINLLKPKEILADLQLLERLNRLNIMKPLHGDPRNLLLMQLGGKTKAILTDAPKPHAKSGGNPVLEEDQYYMLRTLKEASLMGINVSTNDVDMDDVWEWAMALLRLQSPDSGTGFTLPKFQNFIELLGALTELYQGDTEKMTELRNTFFSEEMNSHVFAILSGLFKAPDEKPKSAKKSTKTRKRASVRPPKRSSSKADLPAEIAKRPKILQAASAWHDLMKKHGSANGDNEDSVDVIEALADQQHDWLLKHKGPLEENYIVPYLQMILSLSRLQGKNFEHMLQEVIKPKVYAAPPIREF